MKKKRLVEKSVHNKLKTIITEEIINQYLMKYPGQSRSSILSVFGGEISRKVAERLKQEKNNKI